MHAYNTKELQCLTTIFIAYIIRDLLLSLNKFNKFHFFLNSCSYNGSINIKIVSGWQVLQ